MASVSKRFGEKGIVSFKNNFNLSLIRLTLLYTAIAAVVLLISSGVTYSFFSNRLENRYRNFRLLLNGYPVNLPQPPGADEVRDDLIQTLFAVNGFLLAAAGAGSYFLAKWNLQPIQESYERQRRFLSDASHELRTPLAIVHAELENELSALGEGLNRNQIVSKLEEVQRMNAIVTDLLTVAHLDEQEESAPETVEVNISELIRTAMQRLQPLAAERAVVLKGSLPDPDACVVSNLDLCQRVIVNIIKNAILYNVPNGTVGVQIMKRKSAITMVVTDTGLGIDEKDIERIFDRFYRVDKSRSRASGGSGLGLSIVQTALAKLGGSIAIESELGKGTEVTIIIPDKRAS